MAREERPGAGTREEEEPGIPPAGAPQAPAAVVRSYRSLFLFWAPLAAQWIMMSAEGPFLAAVIARMGEPAFNLAAYGVAFAFALLVESPVIMLMSASTALVEDAASYRRLRNFTMALNAGATALLLLVLVPPVYGWLTAGLLGLPQPVTELVYGALWLLLPWPAAIGYRRFLHGVLIRSGRTRLVAYGTVLRLVGMAGTALLLYFYGGLPGAWAGAAALSAGVCTEALAARIMATGALRELLRGAGASAPPPVVAAEAGVSAEKVAAAGAALPRRKPLDWRRLPRAAAAGYGEIARFYFPLALTSLIALTVQPMLTFFMGRAAFPVESLAVFPVVNALAFLFRSPAFAYQEVVIALAGRRMEQARTLARFGLGMALALSGALALVAFTPLAGFWFETVSGLPPELASLAVVPTQILVLLPALSVLVAFQLALLVQGRTTGVITTATVLEVAGIALLFILFGWQLGLIGVSAAALALLGGRIISAAFLIRPVRRVLADRRGR